jgi:ABC-type nitrate/sulfonate/bicarbonate transport system permease component
MTVWAGTGRSWSRLGLGGLSVAVALLGLPLGLWMGINRIAAAGAD